MKIDTHIHTAEAPAKCGKISAKDLVRIYKDNGYDVIVITNHFKDGYDVDQYLNAFHIAEKEGKKVGLKVLFGMERSYSGADYLLLGFGKHFIYNKNILRPRRFSRMKASCNKEGGIVVQAHPCREKKGIKRFMLNQRIDGLEVMNGHPRHNSNNDLAKEFADLLGVFGTAGSDCHYRRGACRCAMIFENRIQNEGQLAEEIKLRRYEIEKYF